MTKLKSKLVKKLRGKTINPAILICIDCGSTRTFIDKNKIRCRECGSAKKINKE